MNKNEKGNAGNIALNNLERRLNNKINSNGESISMSNHTPTQYKFQYHCSFCTCELADNGLRFNGVGACPACNDLAQLWVDSLRGYEANYFNNLGVRK